MSRYLSILVLMCCCLLGLSPAVAALVPVLDVASSPGLGEQIRVETLLVDSRLPRDGAVVPPGNRNAWGLADEGVRVLGFPSGGIWTRGRLINTSDVAQMRWLVVAESFLDQVDCLVRDASGSTQTYRMGDQRPYVDRVILSTRLVLPIDLAAHGQVQFHCYMRNNGAVTAAFELWHPEQYTQHESELAFARAICYGALIFAIICGVFLAVMQRHPLAFLLIAEMLPILMATGTREGDAFAFVWPSMPMLNLPPFEWILIGIMAASLVFRRVLPLTQSEDWAVKIIVAVAATLLLPVLTFEIWAIQSSQIVQVVSVIVPSILIGICLRHWHDGIMPRLIAAGMMAQLLGLIINALGVLGYIHSGYALAALYASVVKALALAAALALQINQDRRERERAQDNHMQELEQRVAYEAQLRHAVSHHPRYGMPNQALLEEAVRTCLPDVPPPGFAVWILRMNRFGFLESILPRDALTDLVKVYADELARWFAARSDYVLLAIDGQHRVAALDDGTLCFVTVGAPSAELRLELALFVTRRFEHKGLFVAWDPHIGVAEIPAGLDHASGITEEARVALQWCDAHRRVTQFDAERMKREHLAYGLTLDLEGAIERGELVLQYQPKVELPSRRTVSLEALVRWRHPERGMIPPGAFIAEAEATGAINLLTMWAIREAARFLLTLSDASVRVSVNITAFDLATPKFVQSVLQVLAQENCSPNRLILEVTESAALSDRERASEILSEFRTHGIQIALDDFGTGYSSLAILQEMPLDEMKVDRSFVTDLGEVERKKAVLEAMIEVGHRLGLTVTIEGVEHEDSVDWLAHNGCDVVQGFVFSRPLDAQVARDWIAKHGPQKSPATAHTVGTAALSL